MSKYTVLQYFQWGQLLLEKGQTLLIDDDGNGTSTVCEEMNPTLRVGVTNKAVASMIQLGKIKLRD